MSFNSFFQGAKVIFLVEFKKPFEVFFHKKKPHECEAFIDVIIVIKLLY